MNITQVLRARGVGVGMKLVGTATPAEVLAGKTFSNADGNDKVGTMPNRGAVVITPSAAAQTITEGYHNGNGTVAAVTVPAANVLAGTTIAGTAGTMVNQSGSNKSAANTAVSGTSIVLRPPAGYYDAAAASNIFATDADFISANIRADKNIFGLQGSIPVQTGAVQVTGSAQWPDGQLAVYLPNGYYDPAVAQLRVSLAQLQAAEGDLQAANIKSGVNIFGLIGTLVEGMRYATGTFNRPSSTTAVSVSGLGFQPKIIIYKWLGQASAAGAGLFVDGSLTPVQPVGISVYVNSSSTTYVGTGLFTINPDGFTLPSNSAPPAGDIQYWAYTL